MQTNYMESHSIDQLIVDPDCILLSIQNVLYKTDLLDRILNFFTEEDVNVDVFTQTAPEGDRADYAFILDAADRESVIRIAERVTASDPHYIVRVEEEITRLVLSGIGMRTQSGVAARFFQVFADCNVALKMITTSEIRIAAVIKTADAPLAVKALKESFDL